MTQKTRLLPVAFQIFLGVRLRLLFRFLPVTLGRFGDESLLDGTRGHADVFYRAILGNDFHALKVWDEQTLVNFCDVTANATFLFCLTAARNSAAHMRSFSSDFAYSSHNILPLRAAENSRLRQAGKPYLWVFTGFFR